MVSAMKKTLFLFFKPVIFCFISLFFDKKYLHETFFDEHVNSGPGHSGAYSGKNYLELTGMSLGRFPRFLLSTTRQM
jgi:hypothetical protein